MKKYSFILALLIIVFSYSCKKEKYEVVNMGYDYFPIEEGRTSIYKVDSIFWDDYNEKILEFSFFVKYVIGGKFIDNEGRDVFYYKKFYSDSINGQWKLDNVGSLVKTDDRLEHYYDNKRYIRLIFPIIAGAYWDYNALNINDKTRSFYDNVDYSYTLSEVTYDSCALVSYVDNVNFIDEEVHYEIYAKGIGMIYKKEIDKETQSKVISGYSVEYNLVDNYNE